MLLLDPDRGEIFLVDVLDRSCVYLVRKLARVFAIQTLAAHFWVFKLMREICWCENRKVGVIQILCVPLVSGLRNFLHFFQLLVVAQHCHRTDSRPILHFVSEELGSVVLKVPPQGFVVCSEDYVAEPWAWSSMEPSTLNQRVALLQILSKFSSSQHQMLVVLFLSENQLVAPESESSESQDQEDQHNRPEHTAGCCGKS